MAYIKERNSFRMLTAVQGLTSLLHVLLEVQLHEQGSYKRIGDRMGMLVFSSVDCYFHA
jgi:hypothetical protein